ncbi:hypothetical protein RJ640_026586 [Escallonia rubra]|uniref:Reverse transcriptase Ty1/copia-type domain-containing protein n=1 Tax=Escallonia rubra TaxID=112253 RepID=A0AA88USY7_9ASTE|nr:hypothetical protein RJ640_026586 [Escallonia rubra]
MSYILVYVDDIIVTGNSSTQITSLINSLRFEFSLKDLSQFHYFLGIEVSYAQIGLFLSQRRYINDILSKTGWPSLNSRWIGLAALTTIDPSVALLYISVRTVAHSSTQAEYKALADCASELSWLCSLFTKLGFPLQQSPILLCDNKGATYLFPNPVFHARMKHIEIDSHFVHDKVRKKELNVQFISTHVQIANIFTKGLASPRHGFLSRKLKVVPEKLTVN